MNQFVLVNGKLQDAGEPAIFLSDQGYRYGHGLFETMKVRRGTIQLASFHFDRLFRGMDLLGIEHPAHFTNESLQTQVIQLAEKNNCSDRARIRLSVSAGNGGLYDGNGRLNYAIECWPLAIEMDAFNSNGLVTGIYEEARKPCNVFSQLKTSSSLIYALAAKHAGSMKWNDCILLNDQGNIADTTIANIFMVKNGMLFTPSVDQACVAGVMRRYLLEQLPQWGFTVTETVLTRAAINDADELFLTNAIRGIRWIGNLGESRYGNRISTEIFSLLSKTF